MRGLKVFPRRSHAPCVTLKLTNVNEDRCELSCLNYYEDVCLNIKKTTGVARRGSSRITNTFANHPRDTSHTFVTCDKTRTRAPRSCPANMIRTVVQLFHRPHPGSSALRLDAIMTTTQR